MGYLNRAISVLFYLASVGRVFNAEAFSIQTHSPFRKNVSCLRMKPKPKPTEVQLSVETRRAAIEKLLAAATVSAVTNLQISPVFASESEPETVHLSASWNAVDGLNSLDEGKKIVSFDTSAYKAMMDDPARTPFFEKAIVNRLNSAPGGPESQTVLDLGTGPFALFAIIAAQAGAGKVYAIEANHEAVISARYNIKKMGFDDVITVIEGFSNEVTLPNNEKADFAVAEIIGSVATEEGAYATILDAHQRLVKEPTKKENWIPSRIQTYAAPASYTLHNLFQPPAFDWTKLNGEPVRFNCRDQGLQLLSDPVCVEDITFADINININIKPTGLVEKTAAFQISGERIQDNTSSFYEEFRRARLSKAESEKLSKATAASLTGICLYPRLLLDGDEKIPVNSRKYPDGGHQRSHWQTVLPIMNDLPVPVSEGDEIKVNFKFDVPSDVLKPPSYTIEADVVRKNSST